MFELLPWSIPIAAVTVAGARALRARSIRIRRKGYWFLTWSGKRFHFFEPRVSDFDVEDIARSLSHIARFNGHSSELYTVAQHVVLASRLVAPAYAKHAFCHDWPEAYVGDVVGPLKVWLPDFAHAERLVTARMSEWLGLDLLDLPDPVRKVDRLCYELEAASFTKYELRSEDLPENARAHFPIEAWSPSVARTRFLERHAELFRGPEEGARA